MRFGFYNIADGKLIEEINRDDVTLEQLSPQYDNEARVLKEVPEGKRAAGILLVDGVLTDDTASDDLAKTIILSQVRAKRDALMNASDWTQLPDVLANERLTAPEVAEWAAYRQLLADVPNNIDWNEIFSLEDVEWPVVPGEGA